MTEINTNTPANTARSSANARPAVTNAEANRLPGLGSGLDTQRTIDTIIQVERRRLAPVESRKAETQVELDAFDLIKTNLETLEGTSTSLAEQSVWEGKLVESSNEEVVTAFATAGAKPGKNTLIVDRLALNHQIASQGYEAPEDQVGTGTFKITIGEESTVSVVIDNSNDTLEGLKSAINSATKDVSATIIKTGAKEKPYQLVLTSQKTGSEGRINLEIELQDGEAPSFENSVDAPSDWQGVGPEAPDRPEISGAGASTVVVRVIGDNTAEDDHTFTFTAVQTGRVGGESALQMRWKDETGRSGTLELDSFNYAPGEPIDFADGLSLILSPGEIVVADEFTVRTRAERSALFWWLDDAERASGFTQPSPWNRQAEFGTPIVEGPYTGEDDKTFKLTVQGSGQIGAASDLSILWEVDEDGGENGVLRVGRGYEPGTKLALTDGITLALNAGVFSDGSVATFEVTPEERSAKWWLEDSERLIPSEILNITSFEGLEELDEDEAAVFAAEVEFPEELGPRKSSTEVQVSGVFEADEARVYTFTATQSGTVGTTQGLVLRWEDDKGNSGTVDIGDTYTVDSPLPFDAGLSATFGAGRVFEEDFFTVRTRTSTIQPAQDALIRFGATELGGGLEITNSTNELEGVIEGVKLTLVSTDDKPVTITISGDTETAITTVLTFVEEFNQVALLINDLTSFDTDTNQAGPLLGDRDLSTLRDDLARLIIDPVAGLPKSLNMLFALGIKMDNKGVLQVDEDTLRAKIADDFAGVANVFRAKGESDNTGIAFVNLTDDTLANTDGLAVDITETAVRGFYLSPLMQQATVVDETNNTFLITVDGTQSEEITLESGVYSLEDFARELQNKITNDEVIGNRRVRVSAEEGRFRVLSGRFGSRSKISFAVPLNGRVGPPGLLSGEAEDGRDVAGTIGGEPAEGFGRLLRGTDESKTIKGLRLLVSLAEAQLSPDGPEASVTITRGVGSRLSLAIKNRLDPDTGALQRVTNNLREQIANIDQQLDQMNERLESKRIRLQARFNRLETQLSSLRTQQSFLTGQLSGLPGGGGGGAGLPGL